MSTRTALPQSEQNNELKPAAASKSNVEVHSLKEAQEELMRVLYHSNNKKVDDVFESLEYKLGAKREQLAYGAMGILAIYLVVGSLARLLCNFIGFGYPAYASVKAIRTEKKDDDTQWLIYWTTFGFFSLLDSFGERIMSWLPIYWLAKTVFLLYLSMPQTKGAQKLYVDVVDPTVTNLDKYFNQKSQ